MAGDSAHGDGEPKGKIVLFWYQTEPRPFSLWVQWDASISTWWIYGDAAGTNWLGDVEELGDAYELAEIFCEEFGLDFGGGVACAI